MPRSSDSHALVLAALLSPLLACGDDSTGSGGAGGAGTTATSSGNSVYGDEEVCLPRAQLWAGVPEGEGGATAAPTSTAASTGSGGSGGAGSGGGGGLPEGCPSAELADALVRAEVVVNGDVSIEEPTVSGEDCCYLVHDQNPATGRPIRGDRGPILPMIEGAETDARATGDAQALASHWTLVARLEHASIASFAKLTLDLLSIGAPHELVAESQRASLDEVKHAQLALHLARSFGGGASLGAMRELGSVGLGGSVEAILEETLRDGCVNETFASFEAAEQAAHCEIAEVKVVLETIAGDEARHAALAFRVVAWALREGLVDEGFVMATLDRALQDLDRKAREREGSPDRSRLGLLTPELNLGLTADVSRRIERLARDLTRSSRPARRLDASAPAG